MSLMNVKMNSQLAYNNYGRDNKVFVKAMDNFYNFGKSKPGLASIIMGDTIRQGVENAYKYSNGLSKVINSTFGADIFDSFSTPKRLSEYKALGVSEISRAINAGKLESDKLLNGLKSKKEFEEAFDAFYPKSGSYRKYIVNKGNVSFEKVIPKLTWSSKIGFKSIDEYKKIYPNSLPLRIYNIYSERIVDNKVTSKMNKFEKFLSALEFKFKGIKVKF